ncbi:hypothetical protein BRC86_14180 [Halobacteriales archaeon QS_3_64_16]|nr:MAG: hypothetical protein BRC86_14180 [Halobacteriales archaeon QS_3_64_16]
MLDSTDDDRPAGDADYRAILEGLPMESRWSCETTQKSVISCLGEFYIVQGASSTRVENRS